MNGTTCSLRCGSHFPAFRVVWMQQAVDIEVCSTCSAYLQQYAFVLRQESGFVVSEIAK